MEERLEKRGYSDKMVRKQILRAGKFGRNELLNKEKNSPSENKLVLNITYHPAYSRGKEVLTKIHVLLTHNEEHRNVFTHIPLVGFKRGKVSKIFWFVQNYPKLLKGLEQVVNVVGTVAVFVRSLTRLKPFPIRKVIEHMKLGVTH